MTPTNSSDPLTVPTVRLLQWAEGRAARCPHPAEAFELRQLGRIIGLAREHTPGLRDNGDPAFIHQLWIANTAINMIDACEQNGAPPLKDAVTLVKIALCHDLLEDSQLKRADLRALIGERAEQAVYNMSNKYLDENGQRVRKSEEQRWEDLMNDPLSLIDKKFDRSHNLLTMLAIDEAGMVKNVVYTPDKQKSKLREASHILIPAGDPRTIGRYPAEYHPYILSARDTLARAVAKAMAGITEQDVYRTILTFSPDVLDGDNPAQRENILNVIRPPDENQVGRRNNATPVPLYDLTMPAPAAPAEVAEVSAPTTVFGRLAAKMKGWLGHRTKIGASQPAPRTTIPTIR